MLFHIGINHMLFTIKKKIKIGIIFGFFLAFVITGCNSSSIVLTPIASAQPESEKTQDYFAMQTIIANEQVTNTPTPTPLGLSNLPEPWTEIATLTPTLLPVNSTLALQTQVIAIAPLQNSIIYQGPGFNNKMACYVQEGTQLIVTGQTANSAWLQVSLGPDQSCVTMVGNIIIESVRRDLNMQFWVSSSTYNISGNLSEVPIIFQ
jgi:hypothetical protein